MNLLKESLPSGEEKKGTQNEIERGLPVDDDITIAMVEQFAPPRARVRKDEKYGRWRLFWSLEGGPERSISRAWGCRTSRACVLQCLRIAWLWAQADGLVCPYPELFNLDDDVSLI